MEMLKKSTCFVNLSVIINYCYKIRTLSKILNHNDNNHNNNQSME